MEIPKVLTPLTELELVEVLYLSHGQAFELFPSAERLGVAWAQCALELGRGKSIWNFNIGNITAGSKWLGDYYVLKVPPPDPPTLKFRAHESPIDGGVDYWKLISGRYASTIPYFDRGDANGAAVELGRLKYFLAHVETYANGMTSLYKEFMRRGLGLMEMRKHETVPSPEELAVAGRLWRLHDDLEEGRDGLDVIEELSKDSS